MFSFLIVVIILLVSCFHSFLKEIINNNGKHWLKWVVKIILLVVAVYLKSINL